jgi:hypothetical protein
MEIQLTPQLLVFFEDRSAGNLPAPQTELFRSDFAVAGVPENAFLKQLPVWKSGGEGGIRLTEEVYRGDLAHLFP